MRTEGTAPSERGGACPVAAQLRMKGETCSVVPPSESDDAATGSGSRGSESERGGNPGEAGSEWFPSEDSSWEAFDAVESMGTCSLDRSVDTVQSGAACALVGDPAPRYERGPPFATGDVILADMEPGNKEVELALALVTGANHPHYVLEINGQEHSVSSLEVPLLPRKFKSPDEAAERMDWDCTPQVKGRRQDLKVDGRLGSFGLLMDAQLKSTRRAREEKQHAKAAKADDARIPVELWDARVRVPDYATDYNGPLPDLPKPEALRRLRRFFHREYLRRLREDAAHYMHHTYSVPTPKNSLGAAGRIWAHLGRQASGGTRGGAAKRCAWYDLKKLKGDYPTEVLRDQEAICELLWHVSAPACQ